MSILCDSEGLYYIDLLLLILPMTDTAYFISDKQIKQHRGQGTPSLLIHAFQLHNHPYVTLKP